MKQDNLMSLRCIYFNMCFFPPRMPQWTFKPLPASDLSDPFRPQGGVPGIAMTTRTQWTSLCFLNVTDFKPKARRCWHRTQQSHIYQKNGCLSVTRTVDLRPKQLQHQSARTIVHKTDPTDHTGPVLSGSTGPSLEEHFARYCDIIWLWSSLKLDLLEDFWTLDECLDEYLIR